MCWRNSQRCPGSVVRFPGASHYLAEVRAPDEVHEGRQTWTSVAFTDDGPMRRQAGGRR